MVDKKDLKNVGGWLLFFIATLMFFSPLFTFLELLTNYETYGGVIGIIEVLGYTSLSILSGYFLYKKKPYALQVVKIFLITNLVTDIGYSLISSDYTFLRGIIYYIVWISYIYNSERVKIVYGSLKENVKESRVWSILAIIYAFILPIYGIIFAIISIRRNIKNRKVNTQVLSIVALVLGVIIFMVAFLIGFFVGLQGNVPLNDVPENIDADCSNYCYENVGTESYYELYYNTYEEGIYCDCFDQDYNYIMDKFYPYSEDELDLELG